MAASPAGKMTGANKSLVGDFVVLKLVEREIAWALAAGEIPRDDELAARDAVVDWARAYGGSNLADRIDGAAEMAAAVAKRFFYVFYVFYQRAAMHIISGGDVAELRDHLI